MRVLACVVEMCACFSVCGRNVCEANGFSRSWITGGIHGIDHLKWKKAL